jgi:hypothetical protein
MPQFTVVFSTGLTINQMRSAVSKAAPTRETFIPNETFRFTSAWRNTPTSIATLRQIMNDDLQGTGGSVQTLTSP